MSKHDELLDLLPGVDRLPEETCPVPQARSVNEATEEVHTHARALGYRLSDEPTGMLQVLPAFGPEVGETATLLGCWCRRVELANFVAGHERFSWWHVETLRDLQVMN